MRIDGRAIAAGIIADLKKEKRPDKILAAIFVGKNPQSQSFLKQKENLSKELGIVFQLFRFEDSILEEDLILEIKKISTDSEIGGIIVQLPLPPHFNRGRILAAVDSKKDVDALMPESGELIFPLPVEVVKDILDSLGGNINDKNIAIVGRGFLVGKPIIEWLESMKKPFKLFHSKSGLKGLKNADLVITGVGKAGLIKPKMLKIGVTVIDFGYDFVTGKIRGDFDMSNVNSQMSNVAFYTPTPGGTGPILVAEIFKNFYKLCRGL